MNCSMGLGCVKLVLRANMGTCFGLALYISWAGLDNLLGPKFIRELQHVKKSMSLQSPNLVFLWRKTMDTFWYDPIMTRYMTYNNMIVSPS